MGKAPGEAVTGAASQSRFPRAYGRAGACPKIPIENLDKSGNLFIIGLALYVFIYSYRTKPFRTIVLPGVAVLRILYDRFQPIPEQGALS